MTGRQRSQLLMDAQVRDCFYSMPGTKCTPSCTVRVARIATAREGRRSWAAGLPLEGRWCAIPVPARERAQFRMAGERDRPAHDASDVKPGNLPPVLRLASEKKAFSALWTLLRGSLGDSLFMQCHSFFCISKEIDCCIGVQLEEMILCAVGWKKIDVTLWRLVCWNTPRELVPTCSAHLV